MKKRFTRILAAFALLVGLTIPMGMWGQTRETDGFDLSAGGTVPVAANASAGTINGTNSTWNVTINGTFAYSAFQGSSGNKYWQMGKSNSSITSAVFSTSGISGTITSIVVNCAAAGGTGGSLSATVGGVAFGTQNQSMPGWSNNVGGDVTFNGSASGEIVITEVPTSGKACYIQSITVTYTSGGGTPTCATPTFSPEAGTYTQAQNVSISCETEGATIYYTTDGNNPTTSSSVYSGAINVSTNTTIKAMAVKADYNNSSVASATYAIVEHAGTETDPYTVADARAAIDANVGTQGVYATGIVCTASPQLYQSKYLSYYISADGLTTSDQLEAYNGLSFDGASFTSKDDVQVGDEVVIYGNLTKHNTTYEFAQDNVLVSLVRPQNPSITVSKQSLNGFTYVVENGPSAAQSFTVSGENLTANISLALGNDSNFEICETEDGDYTNSLTLTQNNGAVSTTIYVRLKSGLSINTYEGSITLTSTDATEKTVALSGSVTEPILDYSTLPFAYDGNALETPLPNGLTQEGLTKSYSSSPKIQFNDTDDWLILHFNERPGKLTFDIKGNSFSGSTFTVQTSVDGTTYTDLATYTELPGTAQTEEFNNLGENVRYIKWIYTNKSSGNVALGNITLAKYVAPQPSITVAPATVNETSGVQDGTLNITYANLEITDMTDFAIQFYDADNNELNGVSEPDWVEVLVAEQDPQIGEGYVVSYTIVENEGPARTAYFKVFALGDNDYVYSNLVTLSQAAYVIPATADKYVKVTSTDDLTNGQYLIVYEEGGLAFDGSLETLDAVGNTISVTISDGEIEVTNETTLAEFTIDVTAGTIQSASGLYIGQTADANGLESSGETEYTNTITITEGYDANIVSEGGAYLRYNAANNQLRFRYYKSSSYTGQKAIQLYKKDEANTESSTLSITGYGQNEGGYYLIASPFVVDPAQVTGMTTGNYDLYRFDQSQEEEWRNYKAAPFYLIPGKGYLYAHTTGGTFTLSGVPYSGNGQVALTYDGSADLAGWNLIGNPFNETAYLADGRDFYVMNTDGDELTTATTSGIPAMQGVFVLATSNNETVTFTTTAPTNQGNGIALNVTKNRGNVIDRAIVRFGEGDQLPKFQINPNNTKIYVTEGNKDYAVVRSAAEAEMPVSFRASENGTYTLAVEAENVEMNYLHLIDNLTGMDVDLLQTPSYTFEAKTSDYASRFRLVFKANGTNENNAETFAYFNGTNWTVSNVGDATLQVVDVTGRTVANQMINGNAELNLNQPAGVYVIRLVNGDNVKTQKVVVR